MDHSKLFEKYKARYERGGCTKEQLRRIVELGALRADEYEEKTGFQGSDALEACFFCCNQRSYSLQSIPDSYETIP